MGNPQIRHGKGDKELTEQDIHEAHARFGPADHLP
jgi:hypothetical protein